MTLFLLRHGETCWNVEGRKQGRGDSPLTARGREQAGRLGRLLARRLNGEGAFVVTSSPLGRAMETAGIVCAALGVATRDITEDPLLMEGDHGAWEGYTDAEIATRFPEELAARHRNRWTHRFPGGESYVDIAARAAAWLDAPNETSPVVAVTHQMTSRCIRGRYLGLSNEDCLALTHPQDRLFVLGGGTLEEVRVDGG